MVNEATVGFLSKETFTFHLYHTGGLGYRKKDGSFSTDGKSGVEDTYSCGVGEGALQISYTQDKENKTHVLVVESVSYDKQMYFPCEVTVCLTAKTCESPSRLASDVKDYFKNRPIDVLDRYGSGDYTYIYLAKTYYVDNVQVELGETKTVKLICKSLDAMLDKEKFSKTYRGAFASSILEGIITEISSKLNGKLTYDRGKEKDEEGNEKTTLNNLCHLKFCTKKADDKEPAVYEELYHPYLVQYNETFHSFARRVAHRCGEMLYCENGTWTMGLSSNVRTIIATKNVAQEVTGTILSSDTCCEESVFAPKLFTANYTKDTDNENYAANRSYTSGVTSDEYLYQINKKNDKISVTEAYGGEQYAIDFVSAFVAGKSSSGCIRDALVKGVLNSIYWASPLIGAQKDIDDDFEQSENVEKTLAFSHPKANQNANLFDSFYDNVAIAEKAAKGRVVTVKYSGTLANAHLGDAVKLRCADKTMYDDNLYIVTEMHGTVSQSEGKTLTSSHTLNAIPVKSGDNVLEQLFPPFNPDIPIVCKAGSQQAIVVDNADPLRMNRVRVRYKWDYDNEATKKLKDKLAGEGGIVPGSPWIRVTTPFAEEEYGGCNFTLAVGSIVMVDYEDGNIERPYVDGSVMWKRKQAYKGAPTLEKNSSKASIPHLTIGHNGQYIKFSDATKAYSNVSPFSMFMYNLIPPVGLAMNAFSAAGKKSLPNDKRWAGGVEIGDALGFYRIKGSTAARNITIESPLGTVNINAFTGITINAPNGDVRIVGKNITLEAGNNITLKSGTNITTAAEDAMRNKDVHPALSTIGGMASMAAMQIGKSLVDSVIRDSAGIPIELSKLVDLSFLRNMWECLMRPVEGTAFIKSKRNVKMEIGNGNAVIPEGDQSTAKFLDFGGNIQVKYQKENPLTKDAYQKVAKVRAIPQLVRELFNKVDESLEAFNTEKAQIADFFARETEFIPTLGQFFLPVDWQSVYKIFKHRFNNDDVDVINPGTVPYQPYCELARSIYKMPLDKPAQNPLVLVDLQTKCANNNDLVNAVTDTINKCNTILNEAQNDLERKIGQTNDNNNGVFTTWLQNDWVNIDNVRKKIRRQIIYEASIQWAGDIEGGQVNDFASNDAWTTFRNSLNIKTEKKSIVKSMGMSVLDDFCTAVLGKEPGMQKSNVATMFGLGSIGKLINIDGSAGPRAYSEVIHDGGTLVISNTQGKTLRLDKDGMQWKNDENTNKFSLLEYLKAQAQALS